jgi:acyl-CoA thioesterase FadM
MRTIETRAIHFGELAGPLVHDSAFFDWQLISTQAFAETIGYPLEQLIDADEIPYAPVFVQTRIDRYPGVGDRIAVETTPVLVGEHRVVLRYEFLDGDDELFAEARITHVSISPDGTAKPLPETVRTRMNEGVADDATGLDFEFDAGRPAGTDPTYRDSFEIRRPLIEGSELAYFEEYPRLATIALERHLEEQGVSLLETDDKHLRLRQWEWSFNAPVAYGTTLDVNATVAESAEGGVRVFHTFEQDGRPLIEGWSEYGCFDENGESVGFAERIRAALSVD